MLDGEESQMNLINNSQRHQTAFLWIVSCAAWVFVINLIGVFMHSSQEREYEARLQRLQKIAVIEGVASAQKNLDAIGEVTGDHFWAKAYKTSAFRCLGFAIVCLVVSPLVYLRKVEAKPLDRPATLLGLYDLGVRAVMNFPRWQVIMAVVGPGVVYIAYSLLAHKQRVAGPLTGLVCLLVVGIGCALWFLVPSKRGDRTKQLEASANGGRPIGQARNATTVASKQQSVQTVKTERYGVHHDNNGEVSELWVSRPDGSVVGPYTRERIDRYLSSQRVPPGIKVGESKTGPWHDLSPSVPRTEK
jgi:hypothetical protein